ncbi:MAG: pilus assembly protein PilO [Nostocales cyanobacterium]|nr:MAG: pilus assembly protein PilO [Nostocales cyanobacterium]TAF12408.1 MAG: pilus assembly protein PilO [Nostocales cyanobacterium]
MTMSDDLSFNNGAGFDDLSPSYPVLFGITFTPKIIGIVVGSLGVLGAVYMIMNLGMPAWEKLQGLQAEATKLQGTVDEKTIQANQGSKAKAELESSKKLQTQVLNLFANEKSLNTLLLDTSTLINKSNSVNKSGSLIRAQLKRFAPAGDKPEIVNDSSLGAKVDNKLKRQIIKVQIESRFDQMQYIMSEIERLQPLLLVENYDAKLIEPEIDNTDRDRPPVRSEPGKILTSFDLVALMPLTEEEAAKIAAEEAAKQAPPK